MTATRTNVQRDRSRPAMILAAAALSIALIASAWQLGAALRPDVSDVERSRQAAYDAVYRDARSDAYERAYADAWQPAFERGAVAGRSEGAAAGVAAARPTR